MNNMVNDNSLPKEGMYLILFLKWFKRNKINKYCIMLAIINIYQNNY